MQEEVNQQVITLVIRGGRISAGILKVSLVKMLDAMQKKHQKSRAEKKDLPQGKTTLKKLLRGNEQLTNIGVTEKNIKSFERVARKYNIDYGLKKDRTKSPPVYYVFFKARDVDVMKAAFQEYTGKTVRDKKKIKDSILKRLEKAKDLVLKNRQMQREKERGRSDPSL